MLILCQNKLRLNELKEFHRMDVAYGFGKIGRILVYRPFVYIIGSLIQVDKF
jgi:hypothetical protein